MILRFICLPATDPSSGILPDAFVDRSVMNHFEQLDWTGLIVR
jgi:hypothetical protein